MADIKSWANTAGGNTSAPPDGAPEGMAPSTVNDTMRENMAATRRWYEAAEWIDLGHVPTFVDADTITVPGDQTAQYQTGRGIRVADGGFLYGFISSSSFGGGATTVNVTLDSGSITSGVTAVAVHIVSPLAKIRTGQIADDAITLAKLEHGTQGDILYYASAGAPTRLGAGTSGQILKTQGPAANPTWAWSGLLQVQSTVLTGHTYCNTVIPVDTSVPQNTEGNEIITVTITPKSSTSKLIVEALVFVGSVSGSTSYASLALFKDSDASAVAAGTVRLQAGNNDMLPLAYFMTSGTTSAITFKLRCGPAASGNISVNGFGGDNYFGSAGFSSLRVMEVA